MRSLGSIRNLDLLLTIVIGYIGIMSEKADDQRMVMVLIDLAKRIFHVPRFVFYGIVKNGVTQHLVHP